MAWNISTVNNSVDAMQFVVLFFDFGRTCLFRACNKQPKCSFIRKLKSTKLVKNYSKNT